MIKVFIPQSKGRNKTSIRGFWYSQDNKKIYYDYLSIREYNSGVLDCVDNVELFYRYIEHLKVEYKQEAIFYVNNNIGYCYYTRDNIEVLTNRIYAEVSRADLKHTIKNALRDFSGCTIYNEAGRYYIEVFFK
jgi:hypothetical protein